MDTLEIKNKFERMGARARIGPFDGRDRRWIREGRNLRIDVAHDTHGEFYDLRFSQDAVRELRVLELRPTERHLLLMATVRLHEKGQALLRKDKFLCGHDERSWFVAAVPGASVSNVAMAFEALKPGAVREAQGKGHLDLDERNTRKNRAFVRQGEWFFVPQPSLVVDKALVLHNEPIRRGAGKPHRVEFLYRIGGETVYVSHVARNGLTVGEYAGWVKTHPGSNVRWQVMRRNPLVYACGRISHADHATITLRGWHRVVMNTENEAPAALQVAFLD